MNNYRTHSIVLFHQKKNYSAAVHSGSISELRVSKNECRGNPEARNARFETANKFIVRYCWKESEQESEQRQLSGYWNDLWLRNWQTEHIGIVISKYVFEITTSLHSLLLSNHLRIQLNAANNVNWRFS